MTDAPPDRAQRGSAIRSPARFRRRAVSPGDRRGRLRRRIHASLRPAVGHRLGPAAQGGGRAGRRFRRRCSCCRASSSPATGSSDGPSAGRSWCSAPSSCSPSPIRPLGLVVAGPLCFIVAALADRDTRPVEAVVSAVIATLACGFLFKDLLNLPIPFDPMSILGPLHAPYDALKAAAQGARHGPSLIRAAEDCRSMADLFNNLALGMAVALSLKNLGAVLPRLPDRHADRRAAGRRPDRHHHHAAADHLRHRSDRRAHHAGRHLLRRPVRRLDHGHPGQHPRRGDLGGHRRSTATRWPSRAAPASRSASPPSARSSPAASPRSSSPRSPRR